MNDVMTYRNKVRGNDNTKQHTYELLTEKPKRVEALDICRSDGSIRQIAYSDIHDREFGARGTELVLFTAFGKPIICRGRNLKQLASALRNRTLPQLRIYNENDYAPDERPSADDPVITAIEEMFIRKEKSDIVA